MKSRKRWLLAVWAVCSAAAPAQDDGMVAGADPMSEQAGAMAQKAIESLEWGLLLETEGFYASTGDQQESDLVLATFEFTVDVAANEWLAGHVGLLWEEDDTEPMELDEAYIRGGGRYYVRAGRFYLPFGNLESVFISDPLTLELAEINKSSVMAGCVTDWFDVSAGVFKGDNEEVIENAYAAMGVVLGETLYAGIYWLSDITETSTQAELVEEAEAGGIAVEKAGGAGAFANLYFGPFTVNAEFVSALEEVETSAGIDGTPMAYSLEASAAFAEKWVGGIRVDGSDDLFNWDGDAGVPAAFHETGYGALLSYAFHSHATIGLEYMRLLSAEDNGEDADRITAQLAFEI